MLALSPAARAQDWSGFYFGANLGGVWGNSDASADVSCPAGTGYLCRSNLPNVNNGPAVAGAGAGSLSSSGAIGGGQAGYNVQSRDFVYGFEVDLSALDLNASRQASGNYPTPAVGVAGNTFTIGSALNTNWLFTARGRLGWSVSNLLIYATGGLAVTDVKVTSTYNDNLAAVGFTPGASMFAHNTDTKYGFVVGGGAEWALTGNWSLRGEYLYVDFGSVTTSGLVTNPDLQGTATPISISEDLSEHIARAGINYRFHQ
jgi:outer membrane immunogenic protein